MSHEVTIKLAPVITADRFRNPDWDRPDRTLYRRGSLQFLPNRSEVPLVIDHDLERRIGIVDRFFELDWTDGLWICAVGTISDPPPWIERYHTKASFGYWDVHASENRVSQTWVKEVSLLSRSVEPAEPGACVCCRSGEPTQDPHRRSSPPPPIAPSVRSSSTSPARCFAATSRLRSRCAEGDAA